MGECIVKVVVKELPLRLNSVSFDEEVEAFATGDRGGVGGFLTTGLSGASKVVSLATGAASNVVSLAG